MRKWLSGALVGLAGIVVFAELSLYLNTHERFDLLGFIEQLVINVRSEVLTVIVAVLVVELLNRHRTARLEKQSLLMQLGSPNRDAAAEAVRLLRMRGWLVDGSLRGIFLAQARLNGAQLWQADLSHADLMSSDLREANLHKANLEAAKLWEADLHNAELMSANLHKANLRKCDLRGVKLWQAKLRGAVLEHANLARANLRGADLGEALLRRANLDGANLYQANLCGVDLMHAQFNRDTVLPDGTLWTPETDMLRFTNPSHVAFWQPDLDDAPTWYRVQTGAM